MFKSIWFRIWFPNEFNITRFSVRLVQKCHTETLFVCRTVWVEPRSTYLKNRVSVLLNTQNVRRKMVSSTAEDRGKIKMKKIHCTRFFFRCWRFEFHWNWIFLLLLVNADNRFSAPIIKGEKEYSFIIANNFCLMTNCSNKKTIRIIFVTLVFNTHTLTHSFRTNK